MVLIIRTFQSMVWYGITHSFEIRIPRLKSCHCVSSLKNYVANSNWKLPALVFLLNVFLNVQVIDSNITHACVLKMSSYELAPRSFAPGVAIAEAKRSTHSSTLENLVFLNTFHTLHDFLCLGRVVLPTKNWTNKTKYHYYLCCFNTSRI